MSKHKLERFAENATFGNLFQHTEYDRVGEAFPLRGRWREDYFRNDRPIVLELGCGRGEYTVAMARRSPGRNYIGIDRKGARLWRGCKDALEQGLSNVAFLRITIDHIGWYFAPGEVDEIYLVYTQFVSMISQKTTMERLLPMSPKEVEENVAKLAGEEEEENE